MRNALLIVAIALIAAAVFISGPSSPARSPASPPTAAEMYAPAPPGSDARAPAPPPPPLAPASAAELTPRARRQLESDPAAALRDIEHADRLAGPKNEQRRALEIHALVRLGRVGHARALTDQFYRAYPQSREIARLERLTGYHPRPYAP